MPNIYALWPFPILRITRHALNIEGPTSNSRMHARPNSTNTCFIVELVALKAGSFLMYKVDQIKKFIIQILFVFK
ncbi:hypothetical protein NC652_016303 [Populus alba x Populus x berolinensis]|nr:hypothetical protein NC652_016303 [Populus alba x Populus x berolinensis]